MDMNPASELRKHLNLEGRVRGGGGKGKPEMWKTMFGGGTKLLLM